MRLDEAREILNDNGYLLEYKPYSNSASLIVLANKTEKEIEPFFSKYRHNYNIKYAKRGNDCCVYINDTYLKPNDLKEMFDEFGDDLIGLIINTNGNF